MSMEWEWVYYGNGWLQLYDDDSVMIIAWRESNNEAGGMTTEQLRWPNNDGLQPMHVDRTTTMA